MKYPRGELMNKPLKYKLVALSLMLAPLIPSVASSEIKASYTSTNQQQVEEYSQAQLAQILAPIALYPDTLLTQILMAATYPLEIVEAQRWLEKYDNLSTAQINRRLEQKDWDASVKALIAFPKILTTLNDDLTWLQDLGHAFLYDEEAVLDSIQLLRQQADNAGNLSQMDNVNIVKEQNVIIIEPASPEVIYVPYYDTRVIYGNWHWRHHPPVYWHRPVDFAYSYGNFYWNRGVHVSMNLFFGAFHWHKKHVVVHHHKPIKYRSAKHIYQHKHAKRWLHNSHHRRGVKYRSHYVKERYARPKAKHRVVNHEKVNYEQVKYKKRNVIHHHNEKKTYKKNKQVKFDNKHRVNDHKNAHKHEQRNKQVRIEKSNVNKSDKTKVNKYLTHKVTQSREDKRFINKAYQVNRGNEAKHRSTTKVTKAKQQSRSHSEHKTKQQKSPREKREKNNH